jgi:hypothetical protein
MSSSLPSYISRVKAAALAKELAGYAGPPIRYLHMKLVMTEGRRPIECCLFKGRCYDQKLALITRVP